MRRQDHDSILRHKFKSLTKLPDECHNISSSVKYRKSDESSSAKEEAYRTDNRKNDAYNKAGHKALDASTPAQCRRLNNLYKTVHKNDKCCNEQRQRATLDLTCATNPLSSSSASFPLRARLNLSIVILLVEGSNPQKRTLRKKNSGIAISNLPRIEVDYEKNLSMLQVPFSTVDRFVGKGFNVWPLDGSALSTQTTTSYPTTNGVKT